MCVIIVKQSNVREYPEFDILYSSNPDGVGIAIWNGETWVVEKTIDYYAAKGLWDKFCNAKAPCAAHFRMATHGQISDDNAHPFPIKLRGGRQAWLFHNGVLHGWGLGEVKSDTRELAKFLTALRLSQRQLLALMRSPLFYSEGKFAILLPNGRIVRTGGRWEQWGKLYVSNTYWSLPRYRYYWDDVPSWENVGGKVVPARYWRDDMLGDTEDILGDAEDEGDDLYLDTLTD